MYVVFTFLSNYGRYILKTMCAFRIQLNATVCQVWLKSIQGKVRETFVFRVLST